MEGMNYEAYNGHKRNREAVYLDQFNSNHFICSTTGRSFGRLVRPESLNSPLPMVSPLIEPPTVLVRNHTQIIISKEKIISRSSPRVFQTLLLLKKILIKDAWPDERTNECSSPLSYAAACSADELSMRECLRSAQPAALPGPLCLETQPAAQVDLFPASPASQ